MSPRKLPAHFLPSGRIEPIDNCWVFGALANIQDVGTQLLRRAGPKRFRAWSTVHGFVTWVLIDHDRLVYLCTIYIWGLI